MEIAPDSLVPVQRTVQDGQSRNHQIRFKKERVHHAKSQLLYLQMSMLKVDCTFAQETEC